MKNESYRIARKNKDKNFDGKFFFAVVTTGIFCRPSCPAPLANEENVTYFENGYDAMKSGYRPCLRCRPDLNTEFYTANRDGQQVVREAIALIEDGYLNNNKVSDLAKKLNLSERHFRKLFVNEMGISPVQIAKYSRGIFAKKMLLNSNLSITDIAYASGFGSIRQFNKVVDEIFRMTPTEIRKANKAVFGSSTMMLLPYKGIVNFSEILGFKRMRMIKGVEVVGEDSYSRTFKIHEKTGHFVVRHKPEKSALTLEVFCDDLSVFMEVYHRVRRMFDLDSDLGVIKEQFVRDKFLGTIIKGKGIPRLPVAFDAYELVIRAILGQQITVKAATTLAGRIAKRAQLQYDCGVEGLDYIFPDIHMIMRLELEGIGITNIRIKTIQSVNEGLINKVFSLSTNQPYEAFCKDFASIKGIGPWSANYVAMRGLGMVDAFPTGDIVIIKAIQKIEPEVTKQGINELTIKWHPYRAYAALCLWRSMGGA